MAYSIGQICRCSFGVEYILTPVALIDDASLFILCLVGEIQHQQNSHFALTDKGRGFRRIAAPRNMTHRSIHDEKRSPMR